MPYHVRSWPTSAFERERSDLPQRAGIVVDAIVWALKQHGVQLDAYQAKCLGKEWNKLWRLRAKVEREQIRVLCKPYGQNEIVVFRIFKKTAKADERRAYELARDRSFEYERWVKEQNGGKRNVN